MKSRRTTLAIAILLATLVACLSVYPESQPVACATPCRKKWALLLLIEQLSTASSKSVVHDLDFELPRNDAMGLTHKLCLASI